MKARPKLPLSLLPFALAAALAAAALITHLAGVICVFLLTRFLPNL